VPAYNLLIEEGLRYKGYVDIFDAGATLQADIENLRAIRDSHVVTVKVESSDQVTLDDEPYIVANDDYENFRAILIFSQPDQNQVILTTEQAHQLHVKEGASVRLLNINIANQNKH